MSKSSESFEKSASKKNIPRKVSLETQAKIFEGMIQKSRELRYPQEVHQEKKLKELIEKRRELAQVSDVLEEKTKGAPKKNIPDASSQENDEKSFLEGEVQKTKSDERKFESVEEKNESDDLNFEDELDEKLEVENYSAKRSRGRPKKSNDEKAKFFGVWLTKDSQKKLEALPFGQGLATKIKGLLDFYFCNSKRHRKLSLHLEKLLRRFEQLVNENDEASRKKLRSTIKEVRFLISLFEIDDEFIMDHLSGVSFGRYQNLMNKASEILEEI